MLTDYTNRGSRTAFLLILTIFMVFSVTGSVAAACETPGCDNTEPWIDLLDHEISVGDTINTIDLFQMSGDSEDPHSALEYAIEAQTHGDVIFCYIMEDRYLGCDNSETAGSSDVSVSVTDSHGLSDETTFRITVNQIPPSSHAPSIDSIDMYPQNPTVYDDISCRVEVSDQDSDLDYVRFMWYVDNSLAKIQNIEAFGNSYTVQSTLFTGNHDEGDTVRCEASVYDTRGVSFTSQETREIVYENTCGVNVYDLNYAGGKITARIKNTGIYDEIVEYSILIDDSTKKTDTLYLSPGEDSHIEYPYDFNTGDHEIVFRAESDCGHTDSEVFWYHVLDDGNGDGGEPDGYGTRPDVERVYITPQNPREHYDIECYTDLEDSDGDLDYVRFKWYVDGSVEREITKNVYGYSDSAQDVLDSYYTDHGDEVRCQVIVYDEHDNSDSESKYVYVDHYYDGYYDDHYDGYRYGYPEIEYINIHPEYPEPHDDLKCTVKVSGDGSYLDRVVFSWYVDGDLERTSNRDVNSYSATLTDTLYTQYTYYGDYVKCQARVYATNGRTDSDYDSMRIGDHYYPPYYSDCGLNIIESDYADWLIEGDSEYVRVTVQNTANRNEIITVNAYLDNVLKDSHSLNVGPNDREIFGLQFNVPDSGTHTIKVTARANCGSTDTETFSIDVRERGTSPSVVCNYNGICDYGENYQNCPHDCEAPTPPSERLPTSATITPSSLDIVQHRSKTITVEMQSEESQRFSIFVSGVPSDWVSYNPTEDVEGKKSSHILIFPKSTGSYTVSVTVRALSEGNEFRKNINMFVTSPVVSVTPDQPGITGDVVDEPETEPLPFSLTIYIVTVLVIIIAAFVIYVIYWTRNKRDLPTSDVQLPIQEEPITTVDDYL
jgi:hypothetical protein